MNLKNAYSKKAYYSLLSLICIAGVIIILSVTNNFGLGVLPDSITYLNLAEKLSAGEKIDLALWPPLYPAILVLLSKEFHLPLLRAAQILNAALFGFTIFLSGVIYHKHLHASIIIKILGVILTLVSVPLVLIHILLITEPMFILLSILFLYFINTYLQNKSISILILSAILVALASLTRYIGIILAIFGIFLILINKNKLRSKISDAIFFGLVSLTPITIWMGRNYYISGTFAGERSPSSYTYLENIFSTTKTLIDWYLPFRIDKDDLVIVIIFEIFLLLGILYKYFLTKEILYTYWHSSLTVFIVIYFGFLITSSTMLYHQLIDSRYLSPINIPLNFILISSLVNISKNTNQKYLNSFAQIGTGILLSIIISTSALKANIILTEHHLQGSGYTSQTWVESETIHYILDEMPDCKIFSNGPDIINFYSGNTAQSLPRKESEEFNQAMSKFIFQNWLKEGESCIIWFDNINWREFLVTPEDIIQSKELENTVEFDDGSIYFLSKRSP